MAKYYKGPQSPEQVREMIRHLMKSMFICMECGCVRLGRDLKMEEGSVKFEGDGLVPKVRCPTCRSWDFELMDAPK